MSDKELLYWIIANLLTESQLDVVPPKHTVALRYLGEVRDKRQAALKELTRLGQEYDADKQ